MRRLDARGVTGDTGDSNTAGIDSTREPLEDPCDLMVRERPLRARWVFGA